MGLKIPIILGILLVSFPASRVRCASVSHHFRPIREVDSLPELNETVTKPPTIIKDVTSSTSTQSSLTTISDKSTDSTDEEIKNNETIDTKINKVESKSDDLDAGESVTTLEEPKQKKNVTRGTVKYKFEEQTGSKEEDRNEPKVIGRSLNVDNNTRVEIVKNKSEEKTDDNKDKSDKSIDKDDDKSEESKGTGRSLNINIDKYVSSDFHNKNNVFSLPTSPEIEKYVEPEHFPDEMPQSTKSTYTSRPNIEFNFDLTTPQSTIFDTKFQMLVDGIKQNLDEISHVEENEKSSNDSTKYEISKLVDNYKNADNDTNVALQTKEFKNVDIKTDEDKRNKGNKEEESGKSVNYESTYLKTETFEDPESSDKIETIPKQEDTKQENSNQEEFKLEDSKQDASQQATSTTLKPSTTFIPSKKPRYQVSLRNNTIETTAPDSSLKQKKHYESSSLDPLYETYSKPIYENAINVSKRGSVKYTTSTEEPILSTVSTFMDYDGKNFSIPPTASAWSLVSLKEVTSSTPSTYDDNVTDSIEQNSQENNLVKMQITPSTKKENTEDFSSSTENFLSSTKYYKISSSNDPISITTISTTNSTVSTTTSISTTSTTSSIYSAASTVKEKLIPTTFTNEFTTTEDVIYSESSTIEPDEYFSNSSEKYYMETTENSEELAETTTYYKSFTSTESLEYVTEIPTTESITDFFNIEEITTETETTSRADPEISSVEFRNNYETTESVSSTNSFKHVPSKTESENELYTTVKIISSTNRLEEVSPDVRTTEKAVTTPEKLSTSSSDLHSLEEDVINNVTSDIDVNKNSTVVNDPDIEIIPKNEIKKSSSISPKLVEVTTTKTNETTTQRTIIKEHKSGVDNNNIHTENATLDTTSSTELLAHGNVENDSNAGKIAAIAISSVGGVCLILLAGLLLIMRKRQKRVTYGQRCRPVSLDAYSLDNVSVYNSVRRKGALRASKRSYGNPAFDDPVSISHQMNFQSLVKFAENSEAMSAEFDEIPQVTARANEVPPGCETKNRYANVIPLPETRVFLKASDNDPHSDYINANYVTGPKNTRGHYIACQAPMQNTVDDFWRMLWEQQCKVVLMLTNLYENGIEKCADYLPPSEVLDCHRLFGDFQITLKKREVKEKYIISSLQLKNMVSNSWREVTHLWYLGWPERGVPTEANSLIAFLIEARSHLKTASNNNSNDDKTNESCNIYISNALAPGVISPEGSPMAVHCSPGTGRTGTVIACDIAIRDFELTRAVDVPKIVYRVRRDRASAVQTRDQYAFIYKVISLYATKLTGGALDSI